MTNFWRRTGAGVAILLGLSLVGCLGGKKDEVPRGDGAFLVQVSPASLSIPAGGGGFLTVATARPLPHHLDYQGPLALSLQGAPAGVVASGTLSADRTTGTLAVVVDPAVPPQTLAHLKVVAAGGGLAGLADISLTIAPPLPPGLIRPDGVQASGRPQTGGTLANTPVALEPAAATTAADAAQVVAVRHGFLPDSPTH